MNRTERIRTILGVSHGKACAKLRKEILFSLVKRLNLDSCYRCGKVISSVDELTIEHKLPWESTQKAELFWDIENIAFSHRQCNIVDNPNRKKGYYQDEHTAWCCRCKTFKPKTDFRKDSTNWNGYDNRCRQCHNIVRKQFRCKARRGTI